MHPSSITTITNFWPISRNPTITNPWSNLQKLNILLEHMWLCKKHFHLKKKVEESLATIFIECIIYS